MILSRQTAAYETVLPKTPTDSASVVYIISNTIPPRSILNFQQIPSGIEHLAPMALPPDPAIRDDLGILVYTTKDSHNTTLEYGNQLFYPGQVISFSDSIPSIIVPADSAVETQHDQYYIDPQNVGLSESALSDASQKAVEVQKQILADLDRYQIDQSTYKADIVSQQRVINEANRVIDAINVILAKDPSSEMTQIKLQMEAKRSSAEAAITTDTSKLMELNTLIQGARDQLTALAILID